MYSDHLCIAIVRDQSSDLVLLDASGKSRTFSYQCGASKLCFLSHGTKGTDALLTPCFDKDGLHGTPEEECFCGIDTPHIHAHKHNHERCVDHVESGCKSKRKSSEDADVGYLASVILHPKDSNSGLPQFPITKVHPEECNSEQVAEHFSQQGICPKTRPGKRITQVQHGDHVDNLVHNVDTGNLHLEHNCDSCGDSDLHGEFDLISKRELEGDVQLHFFKPSPKPFSLKDSLPKIFALGALSKVFDPDSTDRVNAVKPMKKKCCSDPTCNANLPRKNSHLPTNITKELDEDSGDDCISGKATDSSSNCCASGSCKSQQERVPIYDEKKLESRESSKASSKCCTSGSCSGSKPLLKKTPAKSDTPGQPSRREVRSMFHCKAICCTSEIPIIRTVLEPIGGVSNVQINVSLKEVFVDHDPSVISADEINKALNKNDFGSTKKKDGAAIDMTKIGRSQLFVEKICCPMEIPMINSSLEPLAGIHKVSINIPNKIVYVDHDTNMLSAQSICSKLNDDGFGAHIKRNAMEDMETPLTSFVSSVLRFDESTKSNTDMKTLGSFLDTYKPTQIESFMLDAAGKRIDVVHNPFLLAADDICHALGSNLSLDVKVEEDGATTKEWDFPDVVEEEIELTKTAKYPRPVVILSGIFWLISLLSLIGGNWDNLKYVALVAVLFGSPPIALKAYKTLCRLQFDTNVLMLSATIGAVALQEYTEAGAVAFLFSLSEWLENRATARARNALSAIVQLRPEKANLVHPSTKEIVIVPASSVPIGALVRVKTGEKIPCDGVVVSGKSTVDESSLTGESCPVRKSPSEEVSGGTVNCGMVELTIRTTCTTENSAVSRLIRLVEEAQTNRSETEKIVDEFARYYTPIVIFCALCMVTVPWAFGNEKGHLWTHNGLVLLVIACPCALIISTPVTYVAGLAAAAQRGILIKGGTHLETLGMVKKIAFDKTGTLTCGEFALLHLETMGEIMSKEQILEILGLVEEHAHHPLAQAIVTGVKNEGIKLPRTRKIEDVTNLAGEGVTASVDELTTYIGNKRLFVRLGLYDTIPEGLKNTTEKWSASGGTVGFMSVGSFGIVCAFSVADAIRPEAGDVVRSLQSCGIQVNMLTGDNRNAAHVIGKQLGLGAEQIHSQLLPEEKLQFIEEMKKENCDSFKHFKSCRKGSRIMFCGDGVNDGPALATADVGVAMGAGAALAMETSDLTLLDSNLEKLIYSLKLGKRVIRKIRQNVIFSFVTKAIVAGFTFAGYASLWAAIATDVGSMILVTLNGMTLLPYRKRESELKVTEESI